MGNLRSKMLPKSLKEIEDSLNELSLKKLKSRLIELWENYVYEYDLEFPESMDEFLSIVKSVVGVNLFEEYMKYVRTQYNEDEIDEEFVFINVSEDILIDNYKDITKEKLIKIIIRLYEFSDYEIGN